MKKYNPKKHNNYPNKDVLFNMMRIYPFAAAITYYFLYFKK